MVLGYSNFLLGWRFHEDTFLDVLKECISKFVGHVMFDTACDIFVHIYVKGLFHKGLN